MKISELKECGYYPEFLETLRPDIPSHYEIPNDAILQFYKNHPKVFKEGDGSHPYMSIEECNEVLYHTIKHHQGKFRVCYCVDGWPRFCYSSGYFGVYQKGCNLITNPIPYKVWLNYLGVEPKESYGESLTKKIEKFLEPKERGAGDDYPIIETNRVTVKSERDFTEQERKEINDLSVNPFISDHQKKMVEQYNPNPQELSGGLEIPSCYEIVDSEAFASIRKNEGEPIEKAIIELSLGKDKSVVSTVELLIAQAGIIGKLKEKVKRRNLNQYAGETREIMELLNQL